MAQVVPIKIDTSSSDWQEWAQQHKAEGNGIPIVYVVRADGETLYAKSGTLTNEQLIQLMAAARNDAGMVLNEKDAQTLVEVTRRFTDFKDAGDLKSAIKTLRKAKRYLNKAGLVNSYAQVALSLNQEIRGLNENAIKSINRVSQSLTEAAGKTEAEQIRILQKFMGVRDQYADLKSVKSSLSRIQSSIRTDKQLNPLYESIKLLDMAAGAKSASQKLRYQEKLVNLIESNPSPIINAQAESILKTINQEKP